MYEHPRSIAGNSGKRPHGNKEIQQYHRTLRYRAKLARILGEQYPHLYVWWEQVSERVELKRTQSGEVYYRQEIPVVITVPTRTASAVAHVTGQPVQRIQRYVDAFDALLDQAMKDKAILQELARQDRAHAQKP